MSITLYVSTICRLGGRLRGQVVRVPEVTGSSLALTTKLELFLGRP